MRRDAHGFLVAFVGAMVAVVLATGTGFLVWLAGGGTQPEDVLPAGAVGFARVDLDPSAEQKVAVYELRKRFPAATGHFSLRDDVVGGLLQANGIDYDRDIRSWLGDRIGVAVFPSGSGRSHVLLALQYRDRAAAQGGLTRRAADPGTRAAAALTSWAFVPGEHYVLVGADQDVVTAAAHADRHLHDDPAYAGAAALLGKDQLVVGWADLARLRGDLPAASRQPVERILGASLTGTVVVGARAERGGVEVQARLRGLPAGAAPLLSGAPAPVLAAELPASAAAVLDLGAATSTLYGRVLGLGQQLVVSVVAQRFGLTLPADLPAVLGSRAAVALFADGGVAALTRGGDQRLAERALGALVDLAGPRYAGQARQDGANLLLGTAAGLAALAAPGARLQDTPAFRRAVPDAGDASLVLYLDPARLMPLLLARAARLAHLPLAGPAFDLTAVLRPVASVGLTVSGPPDDLRVRLRATVP